MEPKELSDVLTLTGAGLRLSVRAKPGQSRARSFKLADIGDGKRAVEVSVAADAHEGKANKALIERLAEECGVTKKQVTIKSGETSRLKIIEIVGNPESLAKTLAAKLS